MVPMIAEPAPPVLLPGPFAVGSAVVAPTPAVRALVGAQVAALLESSPAFHALPFPERGAIQADLEKIAAYSAALLQEDWLQSQKLGQTPMVREQRIVEGVRTAPPAAPRRFASAQEGEEGARPERPIDQFDTRATGSVARITEETLNAVAFPTFVADLIKGTFQAVVDASIQQMEAYGELLSNVAKTVDQFMADNISDNQGRDWLANAYPQQFQLDVGGEQPALRPRDDAPDGSAEAVQRGLNLSEPPPMDEEGINEILLPAARRQLARSRQQLLATMVLMGMNRIVVTSGKIRAKMDFRIAAHDSGQADSASKFDTRTDVSANYGWMLSPVKVSAKTSVAYVSTNQKTASSNIEVETSLGGEVELRFKSDYFPLERFADQQRVSAIQANTPVPAANPPTTGAAAGAAAQAPAPTP